MNVFTVQFPDSLHRQIKALAEQEGYSVDQFLASAAAEKMAALMTLNYLRREAAQGRREDFERFLAAVPHREPDETDRLPEGLQSGA
jgi:parvulin-like peptidyl-prolyl isomerase